MRADYLHLTKVFPYLAKEDQVFLQHCLFFVLLIVECIVEPLFWQEIMFCCPPKVAKLVVEMLSYKTDQVNYHLTESVGFAE